MLFNSRRAEVRLSTVESSTGMGLPSAVEGTRLVDDGLGWKGRIKENGKALVRDPGAARPGVEGTSDTAR